MPATSDNQILDIRDYFSPLSVLKVRSLLNTLKDGQLLEVWSNDLETRDILERIIGTSDDEWIGTKKVGEYEKIYIRRCKYRTPSVSVTGMESDRAARKKKGIEISMKKCKRDDQRRKNV